MSTDFILPDIGEGIVECEVVEWLVKEGDVIQEDQVVVEVMTDKAVVEIPAKFDGVVTKLYYKKGDIAKVGQPMFAIGTGAATDAPAPVTEPTVAEKPAPTSASDFILPDIGEGIVECEVVEWRVAEGDKVEEDQVVVEVMTDKAVVEIPAKSDGVVSKLYYKKGDIARVGEPLFALTTGEASTAVAQPEPKQPAAAATEVARSAGGEFEAPQPAVAGKVLASPAVRRRAREQEIDLSAVKGSGKKGRILKEDLTAAAAPVKASTAAASSPVAAPTAGGTRTEAMRGVRAVMARLMTESVQTIPHFTYAEEFDLTELRMMHAKLKAQYAEQGVRLTLMPFFIKAMSLALSEFPIMNAQLNDDATEITYFDDHNIGMAVATKVGLMVPNIKSVQNKSLLEVAEEVNRLTASAREGKVAPADMKGGTITISNIGVVGGTVTTPIINKPEAAIVALGKVQTLPRFAADGSVVGRDMMTASWSGDHRIIDGATIANFNKRWQQFLEDPMQMLTVMR